MNVTEKNLKDFRKTLKERANDLERKVGEILSKFVGEINFFGFDLYSQHKVELQGSSTIFDYAIRIKHRNIEEWVLVELKDYSDVSMLVPQARKFAQECILFEQKYPECKIHRLLIIDDVSEPLPPALTQECTIGKIILQTYSRIKMLDEQIESIGAEYTLLEYLKNSFNLVIRYHGEDMITVEAVKHVFNNRTNYTFSIPAKKLLPLAYVFRATAAGDPYLEEAYQRSIDFKRLPKIKKFIMSDHIAAMFPTNIVANIPIGSSAQIVENGNRFATISIPNEYGALQIIDGQHRLFSLARCDKDDWDSLDKYPFLITAYHQLKNKEQAKIFFSINDEQIGINPNLICYILSRLLEDKEGLAAYVALQLQTIGLFDKDIYNGVGKRNGRWLNLKIFVDNMTPSQNYKENLIDFSQNDDRHGWLQKHPKDDKTPVEILKMYFELISNQFPTDWKRGREGFCQNNAGIAVWLRVLLKIAKHSLNFKDFSESWDRKLFSKYITKCDFRILNKKVDGLDADEWRRARNDSEYEAIADYIWNKMGL